jgi:hypothetical protein
MEIAIFPEFIDFSLPKTVKILAKWWDLPPTVGRILD